MKAEREQGAEEANSRGPELAAAVVFARVPDRLSPRRAQGGAPTLCRRRRKDAKPQTRTGPSGTALFALLGEV